MICLPVLTISSFKRKKKDDLLTCFDDIKFQEEKERWYVYLLWRCQVSRGERNIICLPVLTMSNFKRRKKHHLLTCFDDVKIQEEKEKIICLPDLTMSSLKRRKKDDLHTCFDDVKFQEEKERWYSYLFWRYQVKRRKKDHLLTCFDDIKFKEEKDRWYAYLFWRCQVSTGERKMTCLPVLTICPFSASHCGIIRPVKNDTPMIVIFLVENSSHYWRTKKNQ